MGTLINDLGLMDKARLLEERLASNPHIKLVTEMVLISVGLYEQDRVVDSPPAQPRVNPRMDWGEENDGHRDHTSEEETPDDAVSTPDVTQTVHSKVATAFDDILLIQEEMSNRLLGVSTRSGEVGTVSASREPEHQ